MPARRPIDEPQRAYDPTAFDRAPARVALQPTCCADCQTFQRDHINPAAGMGTCIHPAAHGMYHPHARHYCVDHREQGSQS